MGGFPRQRVAEVPSVVATAADLCKLFKTRCGKAAPLSKSNSRRSNYRNGKHLQGIYLDYYYDT